MANGCLGPAMLGPAMNWGLPGTSSPVALAAAFSHNNAIDHLL